MKPDSCASCPLNAIGEGWVPAQIPDLRPAKLLVVGEAPGATEARTGIPFSGKSGRLFDKLLRMCGIPRDQIAVHNVLSCRPPANELRNQPWKQQAIQKCALHLNQTIDRVKPRSILALGETALETLCGRSGIQRMRGFVLIGPRGIPTIPTYHPAYLLPGRTKGELRKDRPSRFMGVVGLDLRRAWSLASSQEPFLRTPQRYLLDPHPGEAFSWIYNYEKALAADPATMLTWDIETPGKQGPMSIPMLEQPIIRIGFSYAVGIAMSVAWEPPFMTAIMRLLETKGDSTGWNSYSFDNPIIERHVGRPFLQGRHYDMMRAWHVFQSDLPKNLESVASTFTTLFPWKDLSSVQPALYNATDADAQIQISYALRENLKPRNQWDIVDRLIRQLHPILRAAGERGLPIDTEVHAQLRTEYEKELLRIIMESQTNDVDSVRPTKIYIRKPKDVLTEPAEFQCFQKECTCGAIKPGIVHYRDGKKRTACPGTVIEVQRPLIRYKRVLPPDLMELPFQEVLDHVRECGFNPLSVLQVTNYAIAKRHLQLIKADNLDDSVLDALIKRFKDPVYERVRSARLVNKKLGTYVMGYAPDERGNIHTTYNDNPSTLRLGSADVNTQNVPNEIKQMVVAPPGWCFVEGDSAAIEAVFVGYCAKDADYVRLASKGVHDYLNCVANQIPFDAEGIKRSKTEFAFSRKRKKMTVHLSNYGGTPRMMMMQAPEVYPELGIARTEQDFYFGFCPKIKVWQNQVRAMTARTHVIVNEWNFHQYFHEVFDGEMPGEDFNRCLGARPQSLAAFFMRENLLLVGQSEWSEFMMANCNTHDSLALMVPEEGADAAVEFLDGILTRPIPQLDNLRVGCEIKRSDASRSWRNMDVVRVHKFEDPLELSTWHTR